MNDHCFVVLAYKKSPYLEACIQSLLEQKLVSDIVISTSTPNIFINQMATKYNIDLFINPVANGIASDWNFALTCIDRKYITLVHQDDIYTPNYWLLFSKLFVKDTSLSICFSDYNEIDDNGIRNKSLSIKIKKSIISCAYYRSTILSSSLKKKFLLAFGSPIPCPSVTYNMDNLKHFKFDKNYTIDLDWDAWLRISKLKFSIGFINKITLSHRIHSESETSAGIKDNRRLLEDKDMFKRVWGKGFGSIMAKLYKLSYISNG